MKASLFIISLALHVIALRILFKEMVAARKAVEKPFTVEELL